MRRSPGFAVYGFVLAIAFGSVIWVVFVIQARANEFLYYRELAKMRTVQESPVYLCAGPQNIECAEGYTCNIIEDSSRGFGKCAPIVN